MSGPQGRLVASQPSYMPHVPVQFDTRWCGTWSHCAVFFTNYKTNKRNSHKLKKFMILNQGYYAYPHTLKVYNKWPSSSWLSGVATLVSHKWHAQRSILGPWALLLVQWPNIAKKKGVYNNNAYSSLITKNVILMVPNRQQNFTQQRIDNELESVLRFSPVGTSGCDFPIRPSKGVGPRAPLN